MTDWWKTGRHVVRDGHFQGLPGCGEVGYSGRGALSVSGVSHPRGGCSIERVSPLWDDCRRWGKKRRKNERILFWFWLRTRETEWKKGEWAKVRTMTQGRGAHGSGGGSEGGGGRERGRREELLIRACGISCSYHRTDGVLSLMAAMH